MKDLKHLIYFENLLQEANNELVQQAKAEGEHALGYTCYFVPETLLNLPGCFSSRLRAPNTGSIDVGTYYMSSKICSYTRSILERGIEGGYDYLDALLSSETCQMMHRGHEHFEILGLVKEKNPQFFMSMRAAARDLRHRHLRSGDPCGDPRPQRNFPRHDRDRRPAQGGQSRHHGL